jgi:hypothetical protein
MRRKAVAPSVVLSTLAAAALLGCTSLPERIAAPPRAAAPQVAYQPAPAIALEREIRYYFDEQGDLWDDRGRRLERRDQPAKRP